MRNHLFIDISEKLKRRISDEAEAHQDDWALPTLRELAKEYKISLVTAKKAVDVLSMEGLTCARPGVGIKVNSKALKKKSGQIACFSIGVIFLDIFDTNSPVIGDMIHGIVDIQKKFGFHLKFTPIPSQQPLASQISVLENVLGSGVDGLIVASRMPLGIISSLQGKNMKFVWVNNNIPHEKIYSVMFDKSDMYLKVIRRMKELRFRKAAFICPTTSREDSNMFANLCGNSKISLKTFAYDILKKAEDVRQIAVEDTLKLLSSSDKPEIIICGGEIATTGALQAIFSKGLRIPEDIHIISISEQDSLQFRIPVPLDMLTQSFSDLAREAALMLYEMLKGRIPETHIKYLPVNCLEKGEGIAQQKHEREVENGIAL
ncbi:MAG: LacI family DNA-binding transcriptional regulator [Victivallales bacterium]